MSTPEPPTDTRTMKNDAALIADLKRAVSELFDAREELAATKARLEVSLVALRELAQLGGGRSHGNSIAQHALAKLDAPAGDADCEATVEGTIAAAQVIIDSGVLDRVLGKPAGDAGGKEAKP